MEGSAKAREKVLQGQGFKTVLEKSDKDTDILEALKKAKARADRLGGRVCRIEIFGHGTPSGGISLPKPIDDQRVVGGGDLKKIPEAELLGTFLGTLKGIASKDTVVVVNTCWSANDGPGALRDIATLIAGFTGLTSEGFTGICNFTLDRTNNVFLPPRPAPGSRSQTVKPADAEKKTKDKDIIGKRIHDRVSKSMKEAEKALKD